MQRIEITDFDDPRLVDYQNLKDANLAADRGRFIVEGRGNLGVLLERSAYQPDSILLSERTHRSLQADLERWSPNCPVYVAEQSIMDQVVGFPIHRGCLSACTRTPSEDPVALAKRCLEAEEAPRILLLESIFNLDNVGGIFRNAMALGGRAVIVCPRTCDPLYRKAIRTSMGGTLVVPFARAIDWPATLGRLHELGYEILALDPDDSGIPIEEFDADRSGPTALLLGTEGAGLSDEALGHADRRVRIEMEGGVDSLNVSVASAIALHALRPSGKVGSEFH